VTPWIKPSLSGETSADWKEDVVDMVEGRSEGGNATRRTWIVLVVSRGLPWGIQGELRQISGSSDGWKEDTRPSQRLDFL
jgi:hypothetical protein